MVPKPEQEAREAIDRLLTSAGWVVQDRRHLNLHAGPGVARCETDGRMKQSLLHSIEFPVLHGFGAAAVANHARSQTP